MGRLFKIRTFTVMLFLAAASIAADAKESKKEGDSYHVKQILIVGLHDNVKLNYFYNRMIAGEIDMKADSINQTYNTVIAENTATSVRNGDCRFIPVNATQVTGQVLSETEVSGESKDYYSDPSAVPAERSQEVLDNVDADYLLVLNQHYLRWQDQPLRTPFHIVNYTLFDKSRNGVYQGDNFSTCMNLEDPGKLRESSRKSSSKIASGIVKTLDED